MFCEKNTRRKVGFYDEDFFHKTFLWKKNLAIKETLQFSQKKFCEKNTRRKIGFYDEDFFHKTLLWKKTSP